MKRNTIMKILCFYHSADLDGHCSGAIIKRAHPEAECIGINYGDPFPWDRVGADTLVIMVDFGLQPIELMAKLAEQCRENGHRLVWIDHHKTAIDAARSLAGREATGASMELLTCPGIREVGKAGCELAWQHFFPQQPMPRAVFLLGRYDVWDHSADQDVLAFQSGMRARKETRPDAAWDELWNWLFDDQMAAATVVDIAAAGSRLLQYQTDQDAKYCAGYAFAAELWGLKVIAVNRGMMNSLGFASVWDPDKYDAMCSFVRRKDGQWTVSLYTDKPGVDVGEFCKRHGGGGHVQAAGFQTIDCPF